MRPDRRTLIIDVELAGATRRQVGPVGWVVLEVIASSATPGDPRPEVGCSARSIAELIGLSKDTVARSIRVLIERRLMVRIEHRDGLTGRFGATTFRVDLAAAGIAVCVDQGSSDAHRPTRTRSATDNDQLTLLA